jgi:hypothetical protein
MHDRTLSYRSEVEDSFELNRRWRFQVLRPPYTHFGRFDDLTGGTEGLGIVIVARLLTTDPTGCSDDMDTIRRLMPWVSLVIETPDWVPPTVLSTLLTRLSRHGATLLPPVELHVDHVLEGVLSGFDPPLDLRSYLRTVLPRWPAASRDAAVTMFARGFAFDPNELQGSAVPRRQPIWAQVGRAMRTALSIQQHSAWPLTRIATNSTYADHKAVNRALMRAFGVSDRNIRNTVGWEWLIWRFLRGQRSGKGSRWDQ